MNSLPHFYNVRRMVNFFWQTLLPYFFVIGALAPLSAQQPVVCEPPLADLCAYAAKTTISNNRGETYLEILLSKPDASLLAPYSGLRITVRYKSANGTVAWQTQSVQYATVANNKLVISNLQINTLYDIEVIWETGTSTPPLSCSPVKLQARTIGSNTPLVFAQIPQNLLLACKAPIPNTQPTVTGGCNTPSLTFTDIELNNSGCERQVRRTWLATDNCGNSVVATQLIIFRDTEAPRFVDLPPANVTIGCSEPLPNENPRAIDNCSTATVAIADGVVERDATAPNCDRTITRTWIATDACGLSATFTQTITLRPTVTPPNDDPKVPPLPVACGQPYTSGTKSQTILQLAKVGDQLDIGGFPVRLESVSGSNGLFSGKGKGRIPFGNKVVYFEFTSLKVNTDYQVLEGTMKAVAGPEFSIPKGDWKCEDMETFCKKIPIAAGFDKNGVWIATGEKHDPRGFDANGNYVLPPYPGYKPGDPFDPKYDPNGFDANGNHVSGGGTTNEQGCTQQDMKDPAKQDKCKPQPPYAWLNPGGGGGNKPGKTDAGIALATSLTPHLRPKVQAAIEQLLSENETKLQSQKGSCDAMRETVVGLATGLDQAYVFGPSRQFLDEGMHLNFNGAPKPLSVNIPGRKDQIVNLEKKHVELYECDKLLYRLRQIKAILELLKTDVPLNKLVEDMLDDISRLPEAETQKIMSSPEALRQWILAYLQKVLNAELVKKGIVYTEPYLDAPQTPEAGPYSHDNPYNYLASSGSTGDELLQLALAQSMETRPEDLEFQFRQGWRYVGNTHRAFFLEAIVQAREQEMASGVPDGSLEDKSSLLPIKIERQVAERTYTILLDKITFSVSGGSLDAYFILDDPGSGKRIVFEAQGVPFTPGGLGEQETTLKLVSDVCLPLNRVAQLNIKGDGTSVTWGCDGFKSMNLKAEVIFCRTYLTPLDNAPYVKGTFTASMPAWGEFIANITITPFKLTNHPEYEWRIGPAWLDFSDLQNPTGFTLSPNYSSEHGKGGGSGPAVSPLWRGFYLESVSVTLPKKLAKNNNTVEKIEGRNLIIDDQGLTGLIKVRKNIVDLDQGNLGGWAFSIDHFTLAVVKNRLDGGGFGGKLQLSIVGDSNDATVKEANCFVYEAKIFPGELYEFSVKPQGTLKVPLWFANVNLESTSTLEVRLAGDDFEIEAFLTGNIAINGDLGDNTKLNVPNIRFEGLTLANKAPYFRGGTFKMPDKIGAGIGGFKIEISDIDMQKGEGDEAALLFDMMLDLTSAGEDGFAISVGTGIKMDGTLTADTKGRQRWKYKDFSLTDASLDASFPGAEVTGMIQWYKDKNVPGWGSGFRGSAKLTLTGLKKIGEAGITAIAQFGSIEEGEGSFKYFMVDAVLQAGNGFPIAPGLDCKAIGAGVSYHMTRTGDEPVTSREITEPSPMLGASLTGFNYVVDKATGLGIRAMMSVASQGSDELFNANLSLAIELNAKAAGGGVKNITLDGDGRLMAPMNIALPVTDKVQIVANMNVAVVAYVAIKYDFQSQVLHGSLEVYMNAGNGAIAGVGDNNRAGMAEIHFAPGKWYINVGKPSSRIGLKLTIPGMKQPLVQAQSYLCAGTGIEPMPPLPAYVQQLTGAGNFLANESRRASGQGFAFGTSLEVNTGKITYLLFYGQIQAGLGVDVMLQKYGGLSCGSGGEIGINGWYASGQAYAYLNADIGLKFRQKEFAILNVGAAAVLQAKLPNPFWARGVVAGKFAIMGGLIKGNCRFKFTIGQECGSGSDPVTEKIQLINALTPENNTANVDIAAVPEATFLVSMNKSFNTYDDDGNTKEYTAYIERVRLTDSIGNDMGGRYRIVDNGTRMTYQMDQFLPQDTRFNFTVSVALKHNNQITDREERTVTFRTGSAPLFIPAANVAATYPINGMRNLYRNEYGEGFVKLQKAQPNLVSADKPLTVKFLSEGSEVVAEVTASVPDDLTIRFPLPADQLEPNKTYNLQIVTEVQNPQTNEPESAVIYQSGFRVSLYNTFAEKMAPFNTPQSANRGLELGLRASLGEPFDAIEIAGSGTSPSLVFFNAMPNQATEANKRLYSALDGIDFRPTWRSLPEDGSLDLMEAIKVNQVGSESGMSEVTLYHVGLWTTIRDFQDFRYSNFRMVGQECASASSGGGSYSPGGGNTSGSPCSPTNQPSCQLLPAYPSVPQCCCSKTYVRITEKIVLRDLYAKEPVPQSGAWPAAASYRIPGVGYTTVGIPLSFYYGN